MTHNGYTLEFTRRRYGKTTFTWIYLVVGDKQLPTGDPVPKIMPSKADLDAAVNHALKCRATAEEGKK